jgi:peptide-N4-(N-acetyl-beta-glucosaminyl)asparagine amidase
LKEFSVPVKPDKKDGIMKELEWRRQWKLYNDKYSSIQADHKIRLLLKWFKEDFFTWVNSPNCSICKVFASTSLSDRRVKQLRQEWAPQLKKNVVTQLVPSNYLDVQSAVERNGFLDITIQSNSSLLEEVAAENLQMYPLSQMTLIDQCFAFLVRSSGVPTRWVWNSEDHVWVEYYSTRHKRWIHLDPCENAYDDPLLYARNWRKKMAYCIAFDEFGSMDVTRRYVRRPQEEGIPRNRVKESHVGLVHLTHTRL